MHQSTRIQLFDKFSYHIEVGNFYNTTSTYFADYKNFNAQPNFIVQNFKNNKFFLLDNYRYSTNKNYLEAHITLEDNRLFLKKLPLINNTGLTESFHINYLKVNHIESHYTEIGYTLNRLFLALNAGVYAAFEDDQFNSWGFRIGFKGFN